MSEHYFSHQPQSQSSPKTWTYELRRKTFTFTSDVGVFSKNEVDFGSRLLVETFAAPRITGDILDLGCGYGPIGIALAASFEDRKILMADVNERALALAKENIQRNAILNAELVRSDRFSNLTNYTFASIVTNPPIRAGKKVTYAMFEESKDALHSGGELWVVIQKKQGAPSTKNKLSDLFGNVEVVAKDKGYFILKSIKV
ncbi:class I SAM-dependent methyltransferase [Virgibacillus soli]|uniref:Class I SAM-dependent methyltransferase n=1 Tax=Paracerasibacillus soli TaxID=480284 RepID=A0ABU5CW00_9BACI|nr:class I SAM-dependent methyltransferase [Virgibacillus soli]MDY0410036.1 class I SAM-dependent methyltransferase [Virgibacillus soli]